nr:MAG TPA: hypothetical protein [Caudoviricetes sp.]
MLIKWVFLPWIIDILSPVSIDITVLNIIYFSFSFLR